MVEADYRHSHLGRGWDYHDSFSRDPRLAWLWRREQTLLAQILHRIAQPATYLDFACGTGRVTRYVSAITQADTVGVDISASMLEVAAERVPEADLVCADITSTPEALSGRQFDLITAFQFFPNAQAPLRDSVMAVLAAHLRPGGVLVFNNHQNASAVRYRLVRLRGRIPPSITPAKEMEELLDPHGLRLAARYRAGVVPQDGLALWPARLWEAVDVAACTLPGSLRWATDVMYVAVRR